MSAERVIEVARGELGYSENPPGRNMTRYGAAYGWDGVPWCVIFLWWCFREAGERAAFYGGAKTASCGALLRWYREQGQTVPMIEVEGGNVQAGDIAILDFSGKGDTQHCGLVEAAFTYSNGKLAKIRTIEGNTTPGDEGSQYNGGCVASKWREPKQIYAICRPAYTPDPPPPDYQGHWAEDSIRWAIRAGLMTGYEDGSFRPEKPVTRAELATVIKRVCDMEREDKR